MTADNAAQPAQETTLAPAKRPGLFSVTRTGVLLLLVGHLLACVGVIALMPGGWPWGSTPFLAYRLLPVVVAMVMVAAVVSRRVRFEQIAIELLRALWCGVGVLCLARGQPSFFRLAVAAFVVGIVLTLARRIFTAKQTWPTTSAIALCGFAGAFAAFLTLLAPAPSTKPVGGELPSVGSLESTRGMIRISEPVRFDPAQANVTLSQGRTFVQIEPLLTFSQRSPDATWTIFAPRKMRVPAARDYQGVRIDDNGTAVARYVDADPGSEIASSVLSLKPESDAAVRIELTTSLARPVYSHLNTFTQLTIAGHQRLFISFSPIAGQRFEVTHAGYPVGAPSTFACVGADGVFRVMRATSGEKGPFHVLGEGKIDGPLTMSFFDGDSLLFECEFEDFVAQASTEPSPSAGWGVPQNAIEFGLLSADPKSPASIFVTLAATSVGRGWNSVGHAPGVYRNRLVVRLPRNKPD